MKYHPSRSFSARLSLYVLSLTLVIFIGVMVQFYTYSRKQVVENAIEHTHGLLSNIAWQIGSELQVVETALKQSVWMVEQSLESPDRLKDILIPVVTNNELVIGSCIAFIPGYYREKGTYFMPYAYWEDDQVGEISYQVLGGDSYDYFSMDWYLIPKLLKQSYWSEPYYDEGAGNMLMSTYSLPLFDAEGEVYAVFTADISLSRFTGLVTHLQPYSSGYTFLLSRNGQFLAHPDREKLINETVFSDAFNTGNEQKRKIGAEMIAGHTGAVQFEEDDLGYYTFFTAVPRCGWSVGSVCPDQILFQSLDGVSARILGVFLVGLFILLVLIYRVIRQQVRPLERFSESARSIASGRFDVVLPEVSSKDEIKDLRDSLSYMQESLRSYIHELRTTTAAKERFESELSIAREIQMGMIPKAFPGYPERVDVDLYAALHPAKEVGGDLYDFFINDDQLYFIIGDVSGKGVPASLFMAIARSLFRMVSLQATSPAQIVSSMNHTIANNNESSMFVTLIVGVIDLQTGHLRYCNAGHNYPLLIGADGQVTQLHTVPQIFVGVVEEVAYREEEIQLEKGSRLFLYTDGVSEAENASKELYGEERLQEVLGQVDGNNARAVVETVLNAVSEHVQGAEASDDITILTISLP